VNRSTTAARIVVIDSHTLFAECLCLGLCQRGHHAVAVEPPGRASSVALMLAPVLRERPDIALVNIARTPAGDGIRLVHPLALSGVHVVVVTEDTDRARWGQALSLGARTIVAQDVPLSTIAAAVRRLRDGTDAMAPEDRRVLVAHYQAQHTVAAEHRELLETLSQRESEILSHLTLGHAVGEIAQLSFVSQATVRSQVKSVLAKLGVSSQLAAVALARQSGWVPCDVARDAGNLAATPRTRSAAS
jgi:two-component system, NarL family, nitrate/nitrite response regulator NarL